MFEINAASVRIDTLTLKKHNENPENSEWQCVKNSHLVTVDI